MAKSEALCRVQLKHAPSCVLVNIDIRESSLELSIMKMLRHIQSACGYIWPVGLSQFCIEWDKCGEGDCRGRGEGM